MLRLLGILSLGNLLFGGRHHRRALGRGLLFGALLGYLANKDFNADRVAEDLREKARKAERTARDAVRAAKREIRKAKHDRRAAEIHEKVDARTAAMAADVPTIDFPEGDGKYDSSKKYGYAQ